MKFKAKIDVLKIDGVMTLKIITPQTTSYVYKENSKAKPLDLNIEWSDDGKTMSIIVEHPKQEEKS
tara:strand:- start:807 stop:1004 length:198 start_codon:yes stop_codon:yes gene_type:complete